MNDISGAPHGSRVWRLHEAIREAVEEGRLAPGQRLVEADLTREYGVGRGALREALRLLAVERIVELVPNRGAIVRRLTPKEIIDTMAVRVALEGLAAALAARNIAIGNHREQMQAFCARFAPGTLKPMPLFLQENKALHGMLVRFADNDPLSVLIDQMRLQLFPKRTAVISSSDEHYRLSSSREHLRIATAVLDADPVGARAAMEEHLANARERMMAQLG